MPWNVNEAITLEESLTAYTSNAAYQLFADSEIGKLESGMRANFVILNKSPFGTTNLEVKSVWIDGLEIKVN